MKQADLARRVGISPSYLNLIEHNRRRIGGKLLAELARCLGVEMNMLSEGAEDALLTGLRTAASEQGETGAELDRAGEFAGRFPGWAGLLDRLQQKNRGLSVLVEALSDRLAHDADLSAALHEVLSTATAIRSTADILAGPGDLDANWLYRFHKNIQEEAHRLSEGAQALVGYLDNAGGAQGGTATPQDRGA